MRPTIGDRYLRLGGARWCIGRFIPETQGGHYPHRPTFQVLRWTDTHRAGGIGVAWRRHGWFVFRDDAVSSLPDGYGRDHRETRNEHAQRLADRALAAEREAARLRSRLARQAAS